MSLHGPNPGAWTPLQTVMVASAYIGTLGLAGWLGWLIAMTAVAV